MQGLQKHHIIHLFVAIDDTLPASAPSPEGGRPALLSDSELMTILLWSSLTEHHHTLKDIHDWAWREYGSEFPRLPGYKGFVAAVHRLGPRMGWLLQQLLDDDAPVQFVDSTMVEVCRIVRADRHRVAQAVAAFGKNHQGWHYGFKLHAGVNAGNQLCSLALTPANHHDAQTLPRLVNNETMIAVGDAGYTAKVMRRKIWDTYGCFVLSPPHYTQRRQILAAWQLALHRLRPKIEATFGVLKTELKLVTSYPRSVRGYLVHYLRVLLGYQVRVLGF